MGKRWVRVSDNMILNSDSGVYYARKFRAGKGNFFQTTGLKKKTKAQSKADDMIARWLADNGVRIDSYATVSAVVDSLLLALEQEFKNGDRAKETWLHDQYWLPLVKKYFGPLLASQIDEAFWINWVRTEGRQLGRTLGDLAKYLSKVLSFAYEQKVLSRKPRIRNPDTKKSDARAYSDKDLKALFAAADPTLRDLIIIGIECGVRPGENRELRWEMVVFKRTGVTLQLPEWFTKTRTYREFLVGPQSARMLKRRYKKRNQESPFVFPSPKDPKRPLNKVQLSRKWRKAVADAKLEPGIKFHWLRHTFFTRALLDAGKELPMVAAYGGNSPKVLFDRYLSKEASRTQDIAGAVNVNFDDGEE